MRIVTVQARIRSEALPAFLEASVANGRASVGTEPGCRRFDVFRDTGEPNLVGFTEVYDDDDAATAHGETAHFATWVKATDGMAEGDMIWATCRSLTSDPTRVTFADEGDPVGGRHVFQARLMVVPESLDEVIEALTDQATTSVNREPGCLRFDVAQSLDDPAEVWLYEVYEDPAAFETHRLAPHSVATKEKLKNRLGTTDVISGPNVWPPDAWDWE
jgi:quinol monooxygenase YgiN